MQVRFLVIFYFCIAFQPGVVLSVPLSFFGNASLCALRVAAQRTDMIDHHRKVLREYFAENVDTDRCVRLRYLYDELCIYQDAIIAQCIVGHAYEVSRPEYQLLLLSLPCVSQLRKFSIIKTVEAGWSWYVRLYWLMFLGLAVGEMSLYGVYALFGDSDKKVAGPALSPDVPEEYEVDGSYYMPFDMRRLWCYGPNHKKFRGVIALLSAGVAAKNVCDEVKGYVAELDAYKKEWDVVARALSGFSIMKQIYLFVADNFVMRRLPECAPMYDFFEVKIPADKELAELVRFFEDSNLTLPIGTFTASGKIARFQELFSQKIADITSFIDAVGAVEVYVKSANMDAS